MLCWIVVLTMVMLAAPVHAATYTTSPGDNLPAAITRLRPGDTLLLQDGVYTLGTTGLPDITCGSNAVNGLASAPITLKAVHERQAHLSSDGTRSALQIQHCAYWVIEGLYLSSGDNPRNDELSGTVVNLRDGQHITFRRNLVMGDNRYFNGHLFSAIDSDYGLWEENEGYFAHRHGIVLFTGRHGYAPTGNVLRRNYLHSRGAADIAGGRYSGDPTRGDTGISCYPCTQTIIENNIVEGFDMGFDIQAKTTSIGNQYLGNIALGNHYGAVFTARGDFGQQRDSMPQQTQVTNFLALGNTVVGLYLRSNKNTRCDQCSLMGGGRGLIADRNSQAWGDGAPTFYGSQLRIAHNHGAPVVINDQADWALRDLVVMDNGDTAATALDNPHVHQLVTTSADDPCPLVAPDARGATILTRYQDGVLTQIPLWDPLTGSFPCGAIVAGVNDIAGSSCFDVHQRLNVNSSGCTLPNQGPLPAPFNLRLIILHTPH